jgi:hypothetical protein
MGRVALKTIRLYLAVIYFIYINHILLVIVFKNVLLYYMLDRATSLNPSLKEATLKLLILHTIFTKIITNSNSILEINIDAAFCFAFIGCLYMGEISYTNKQQSELLFTVTKITYLDIQFSPSRDYFTFYFKWSKTNKDKQGV